MHAQSVAATMQKELRTLESDNGRLRAELKKLQDQVAFAEQEGSLELRRALIAKKLRRKNLSSCGTPRTKALDKVSGNRKWLTISLGPVCPGADSCRSLVLSLGRRLPPEIRQKTIPQ